MKILVLIHEFPPIGGGGGRVARDIAVGLAERGHEIRVLTAHIEGLPLTENILGKQVVPNQSQAGLQPAVSVRVERMQTGRKTAFRADLVEMGRYNLSALRIGQRIIRAWQPDVIHAHFAVPAGASAFLLSKLTGVPYVLTAHLGDVPGAVPEKTDQWFKWIYPFTPPIWRGAAKVVAVSEFTRQMALQRYHVPIVVIPNGVELATLPAPIPRSSHDPVRIVFAGRFMQQKNPADLVQALLRLRDLPWQCSMLGDGPLLESIRENVASCGLSERCWLPGWVTPEQVLLEFARSDLLILPSRSEGLSVVGVQALGMGLAMLLSNVGGNLELVNNGENGFLFPVGNIDALTDRLKSLLENPSMLQSAQIKSREMSKSFDLAAIILQYESVFSNLPKRDASRGQTSKKI